MTKNNLVSFRLKVIKVFLGYSSNSRAYRVHNLRTQTIMELINVVIDDYNDVLGVPSEDEIYNPTNKKEK